MESNKPCRKENTIISYCNNLVEQGGNLIESNPIQAKELIKHGLKCSPLGSPGWLSLGICHHSLGQINSAINSYQIGIKLANKYKDSCIENMCFDLLRIKNYKEGWIMYEKRSWMKINRILEKDLGRIWAGSYSVDDLPKKLMLTTEQGLGDTIHFLRFAIYLNRQGVEITILCQVQLVELIKQYTELKDVIGAWDPTINIDPGVQLKKCILELGFNDLKNNNWAPLMSLPKLLNWTDDQFPFKDNYLIENKKKKESPKEWPISLNRDNNKKLIGIYWQGNEVNERSLYSKGRSMPIILWENIMDYIPESVEFVSLQKGLKQGEWKDVKALKFVKGQQLFDSEYSLISLANVILDCNLIVTTDSIIAHLSGALGVKTYLLLKWMPDWRWGIKSNRNDWYESIDIIRQDSNRDWKNVIKEVGSRIRLF